jgi:hypothetical protein
MSNDTMISKFKRAAILCAALFAMLAGGLAALPANAQELDPEHLAVARKYVELTDKSGIYETAVVETAYQTMQTLLTQNPEIAEPLNKAIDTVVISYKDRKGELIDQFARVYALNFTKEELTEIVAFYSSPVGAKLATANATLNESMQTVMAVFQNNLKTEFFAQVRAEMKTAGFDL